MSEQRQTIQKSLVLDAVRMADNHPTTEQIYQMVVKKYPSISRSTVYRNLRKLVEEKKIRLVKVANGPEHFDKTVAEHAHIQCIVCNRVSDICVDERGCRDTVVDGAGYVITGKQVLYQGICPECQKKCKTNAKE